MPLQAPAWLHTDADETGPNPAEAGAPAPEPAPAPTREADAPAGGGGAEVVPLHPNGPPPQPAAQSAAQPQHDPHAELAVPTRAGSAPAARLGQAARVWVAEAGQSAAQAVDGSVWRARPPALRDMHARISRAEWAGELASLRIAGQAAGYVCLTVQAAGYGLLWVAARPGRLLIALALTIAVIATL